MFNHIALVCWKTYAGTKYWVWNWMMNKHCWNFLTVYSVEVWDTQSTCLSTLNNWCNDMQMLYFILGLLIRYSHDWWSQTKDLQRWNNWWWLFITYKDWGNDMQMLYFILGLLIRHSHYWWSQTKDLQRWNNWWWLFITHKDWGNDMQMLYFILGLLIRHSHYWWSQPKTCKGETTDDGCL